MATNPIQPESSWGWPSRGGAMSEEEYHELERLNPERKYEYIAGLAYMMSGGSVGHDRILYNVRSALDSQLRSSSCAVFGVDVQVLLGHKKSGKRHFVYPDATVSCHAGDNRADNTLIEAPRVVVEVLSPSTETRDRGVKFKVCNNTLKGRNLTADAVDPLTSVVPSAVIEILRLQTHERFAYFHA